MLEFSSKAIAGPRAKRSAPSHLPRDRCKQASQSSLPQEECLRIWATLIMAGGNNAESLLFSLDLMIVPVPIDKISNPLVDRCSRSEIEIAFQPVERGKCSGDVTRLHGKQIFLRLAT